VNLIEALREQRRAARSLGILDDDTEASLELARLAIESLSHQALEPSTRTRLSRARNVLLGGNEYSTAGLKFGQVLNDVIRACERAAHHPAELEAKDLRRGLASSFGNAFAALPQDSIAALIAPPLPKKVTPSAIATELVWSALTYARAHGAQDDPAVFAFPLPTPKATRRTLSERFAKVGRKLQR
jgi:hypothetical protein